MNLFGWKQDGLEKFARPATKWDIAANNIAMAGKKTKDAERGLASYNALTKEYEPTPVGLEDPEVTKGKNNIAQGKAGEYEARRMRAMMAALPGGNFEKRSPAPVAKAPVAVGERRLSPSIPSYDRVTRQREMPVEKVMPARVPRVKAPGRVGPRSTEQQTIEGYGTRIPSNGQYPSPTGSPLDLAYGNYRRTGLDLRGAAADYVDSKVNSYKYLRDHFGTDENGAHL